MNIEMMMSWTGLETNPGVSGGTDALGGVDAVIEVAEAATALFAFFVLP